MTGGRLTIGLLVLLTAVILTAVATGPLPITLAEMIAAVRGADPAVATILVEIRLPRTLSAAIAGIALGASGAAMQGLLRNPLAEPGVMGVSASAATAATAAIYFGLASIWPWVVPIASLSGALAATALIAGASFRLRGVASLILLGVAISALAGAVMALFVNLAPNPFSLSDLINWTAGSVANRDWGDIGLSLPFVAAGLLVLRLAAPGLSAMALGEETAHGLGVDLARHRLMVIVGTGLATGGAVALAGMIGFVGLIAPHMVRAATRHDAGMALVPAALAGGCLLTVGDIAIRLFPWGNELHLGTLAALIGAPLFALIALRQGSVRHG